MIKYLIVLSSLFFSIQCYSQTAVFRAIEKKYNQAYKAFLYPSTLRALNLARNEDLDNLLSGIEEAAYISVSKTENFISGRLFHAMSVDLNNAGFMELMSMTGPQQKFAIFSMGKEDPNAFVFIMENTESLSMLDIQGEIDLSVISKIDQIDISSFQDILKQKDNKDNAGTSD